MATGIVSRTMRPARAATRSGALLVVAIVACLPLEAWLPCRHGRPPRRCPAAACKFLASMRSDDDVRDELARLLARRFTVQERIGQQLADALERILARTGGGAPVHADARRPRDRVRHPHHLLARNYHDDPDLRTESFGLCHVLG